MSLGEQVRYYRSSKNWTLETLAEKSGVEVGTINALENRKSKRSVHAPALAKAFGLTVEQLLDETLNNDPTVTKLVAREPAATYSGRWPLQGISADHWENVLTEQDRGEIIGFAKSILMNRLSSARQTKGA